MDDGGDAARRVGFEGAVWLLREKKSTFYAAQWRQELAVLRSVVLPPWPRTQVLLELEQREFLVLRATPGDASAHSGNAKEPKRMLRLEVRSMEDVRRAQRYQTAARTQTLELFLDVEFTRDRLLRFIRDPDGEPTGPDASPAAEPTASSPLSATQLINDAFAALEHAQQTREAGRNLPDALRLYQAATHGFEAAERLVPDDRTRRLLQERCQDLHRSVRSLEAQIRRSGGCSDSSAGPDCNAAARRFPEPPTATTSASSAASTHAAADVRSRLQELRRFAAEQQVGRAQREHATTPSDLAVRLAALRNEKPGPAPPVSDLSERLRRLRGGDASVPAAAIASGDTDAATERKSAVDRVIEQVQDELALGIRDEDELEQGTSETSSKSSSSSSSSSSSEAESSASEDERASQTHRGGL